MVNQRQGEKASPVQRMQVDLIPEDQAAVGDLLLLQEEGALCAQGELRAGDVQHRDECRPGLQRGLQENTVNLRDNEQQALAMESPTQGGPGITQQL